MTTVPSKRPTVLVVDDDATIRRAVVRTLDDEPYRVIAAESGDMALSVLEREAIDVVLSDYQMPAMNGIELLARVRELHPRITRLMLTSNEELSVFADALRDAGVRRFFRKPWEDDELRSAMRGVVRDATAPALSRNPLRTASVARFLTRVGIKE